MAYCFDIPKLNLQCAGNGILLRDSETMPRTLPKANPSLNPRIKGLAQLGATVKAQRGEAGLRIDDAASLCGVSQDLFSRLENGKPVRTDKLMQVLQGLGLNLFAVHNESASRLERALDNLRMRDREGAQ
jgi:Helix-turn-helix domain